MNPTSNNTRDYLGEYSDAQTQQRLPDIALWGGLLVSITLLTIYCLIGGLLAGVIALCVLILGLTIGVILNGYKRKVPLPISNMRLRAPVSLQPLPMPV
jgi:hypothetical protein